MNQSKQQTTVLQVLLIGQTLAVLGYTALAVQNQGWNLFPFFIGNLAALGWNGQFNLDFSCYLVLSGLWIMWRNQFKATAVAMGLAAMVLGYLLFAPYLLFLIFQAQGNLKTVLIGDR
ncbi:MAG TPA: hypothetical protein DCM08_07760 [Microscillaceae bacterium]|jgi:hypothetical protein|nr:hypothetical protein [Microscillaceae bacterium]